MQNLYILFSSIVLAFFSYKHLANLQPTARYPLLAGVSKNPPQKAKILGLIFVNFMFLFVVNFFI